MPPSTVLYSLSSPNFWSRWHGLWKYGEIFSDMKLCSGERKVKLLLFFGTLALETVLAEFWSWKSTGLRREPENIAGSSPWKLNIIKVEVQVHRFSFTVLIVINITIPSFSGYDPFGPQRGTPCPSLCMSQEACCFCYNARQSPGLNAVSLSPAVPFCVFFLHREIESNLIS